MRIIGPLRANIFLVGIYLEHDAGNLAPIRSAVVRQGIASIGTPIAKEAIIAAGGAGGMARTAITLTTSTM